MKPSGKAWKAILPALAAAPTGQPEPASRASRRQSHVPTVPDQHGTTPAIPATAISAACSKASDRPHKLLQLGQGSAVDRRLAGVDAPQQADTLLENGLELAQDGVVCWHLVDLCTLIGRRFGVRYQKSCLPGSVRAESNGRATRPLIHPRPAGEVGDHAASDLRPNLSG